MLDLTPEAETLLAEVLAGLQSSPKTLPCKLFYDEVGAKLFEDICELDEYYVTRTELAIMDRYIDEMAAALGPDCLVIEYGSGSGQKTELLLEALETPVAYVPVDISCEQLADYAQRLRQGHPDLEVAPVCADYTHHFELPETRRPGRRRMVYFPGSTIGNFDRGPAEVFMRHIAETCGPGGALLIGADLDKDPAILERAYDDAKGVTAAFNLNLLTRLNRELGADFDLEQFRHRAIYNRDDKRIEMHLESLRDQTVQVGDTTLSLAAGETICTEHSNKYSVEDFRKLAAASGFGIGQTWIDEQQLFSVHYLEVV